MDRGIGLKERGSTRRDLQVALARLEVDLKFIHSGKHTCTCSVNLIIQKYSIITTHIILLELLKAQSNYEERLKAGHPSKQVCIDLGARQAYH